MSHEKRTPREYLIDGIVPKHGITLLGGPISVGKTTWLIETLVRFINGEDILGASSRPCPIAYWSADRDRESIHETLDRLGIKDEPFDIYDDQVENTTVFDIPTRIKKEHKLLIIEGIAVYCQDGRINDYATVARWLKSVRKMCKQHDLTIIGTTHSAKPHGETVNTPYQRFIGSVAWGGYADTLLLLEPNSKNNDMITDPARTLFVMPKNRKPQRFDFVISSTTGALIPGKKQDENRRLVLLFALPKNVEFARKHAVQIGQDLFGLSERTVDDYLHAMKQTGELIEGKNYGTYLRNVEVNVMPDPEAAQSHQSNLGDVQPAMDTPTS